MRKIIDFFVKFRQEFSQFFKAQIAIFKCNKLFLLCVQEVLSNSVEYAMYKNGQDFLDIQFKPGLRIRFIFNRCGSDSVYLVRKID